MKVWKAILAVLFSLFILGGTVYSFIQPDRTYSSTEKRNLASFPVFSFESLSNGSFMDKMESYEADQFPFRDFFMTMKVSVLEFLGQKESQGVYRCSDGSLIESFSSYDEQNLLDTTAEINAFLDRHPAVSAYFLIAPTAVSVYADKLPAHAITGDQNAYLDHFFSLLSEDATIIDVRNAFSAEDSVSLYYDTDHHWTGAGANIAYREAAAAMSFTVLPNFTPRTVCNEFLGSLASKSGFRVSSPDTIELYFPDSPDDDLVYTVFYADDQRRSASVYETSALETDDPYQIFFGGNHSRIDIETTAGTDRTLILIKDSYANAVVPYLLHEYSKIIVIDPRYYYDDLDALLIGSGKTDVLFLYNASTLSQDTSLKMVLKNDK